MIAVLLAAAVGLVSAFSPVTPVEPYLLAAVATTAAPPAALGLAAAAGQTAGKLVLFLGTRGAVRSPWLRRRLARRGHPATPGRPRAAAARLVELLDRPRQATAVLLLSSVTGFPPLLAAAVYLARTPMRPAVFTATCFAGRAARFTALAFAPGLVTP